MKRSVVNSGSRTVWLVDVHVRFRWASRLRCPSSEGVNCVSPMRLVFSKVDVLTVSALGEHVQDTLSHPLGCPARSAVAPACGLSAESGAGDAGPGRWVELRNNHEATTHYSATLMRGGAISLHLTQGKTVFRIPQVDIPGPPGSTSAIGTNPEDVTELR